MVAYFLEKKKKKRRRKKVVATHVDDLYMEHIFCWASLSYITNIFLNLERNCCLVVKVLCIQYFKQVDQRNIFIWRGRTLGSIHSSAANKRPKSQLRIESRLTTDYRCHEDFQQQCENRVERTKTRRCNVHLTRVR